MMQALSHRNRNLQKIRDRNRSCEGKKDSVDHMNCRITKHILMYGLLAVVFLQDRHLFWKKKQEGI